ncbi:MAG: ATP synthase F0 subunit C [Deltaproteobacteria bacterium]|nr:ATP synthase F0 subunit C [Deltaproteobacteria bacterium]
MKKYLVGVSSGLFVTLCALAAWAQPMEGAAAGSNQYDAKMAAAIGAGLAIGLAAFGGSLGQGRAAAAALEGIARNPSANDKIGGRLVLGLALIESLVLYALLIAIFLYGKT